MESASTIVKKKNKLNIIKIIFLSPVYYKYQGCRPWFGYLI